MRLVVTTAGRPDEQSLRLATEAAAALSCPVVERGKRSVAAIQRQTQCDVLVAGKDRYAFYKSGQKEPLFFHPNSATYRLRRMQNGETDPLITAAGLCAGDSFLDCTLGFGSDAIIASAVAGPSGQVTGLEADPVVAYLTSVGLRSFSLDFPLLEEAMQRVTVIQTDAIEYLKKQSDNSWDVVYLDPMFTIPVEESDNFQALREAGAQGGVTAEWVAEARRVCRRRVVLKDHFRSPVFQLYGFEQQHRLRTKVHYGIIEKEKAVSPKGQD